jgi:Putative beta-barrel porin-2, OmpL-like. bbp2
MFNRAVAFAAVYEFHTEGDDMKFLGLRLRVAATLATMAVTSAAYADALPTPAMGSTLAANPNPFSVDTTDWLGPDMGGKIYVGGAVTGLAYYQSSPTYLAPGDAASYMDLSNAQVFVQKTDGVVQFFADFGEYSFPTIGVPYFKSSSTTSSTFGVVPEAYLKLQGQGDLADFSIEAGKLPTLIGDELGYTFQNMNVERGLLWNLEPLISRGVQINYSEGPLNVSFSWNDGTYSNVFSSLSGLISYGFNGGADTLAFAGGGSIASNPHFGALNSGSYYNLIYTHTSGPWTVSPYLQYVTTPKEVCDCTKDASSWGGALLVSYAFDDNWKLAGRVEYETSSGDPTTSFNLIGYGAGSNAWSFTLTPTYQWKVFFIRADASYITTGSVTAGDVFGAAGTNKDQGRLMLEAGVLF